MTHREFCYWLDGFFALDKSVLTEKQVSIIDSHLNLVEAIDEKLTGFPAWLKNRIEDLDTQELFSTEFMSKLSIQIRNELQKVAIGKLPKYIVSHNR